MKFGGTTRAKKKKRRHFWHPLSSKCTCRHISSLRKHPSSLPLGAFHAEERLRPSDRNSILVTQINVYVINPVVMGFQSRRRSSEWNVPSSGERGETDVFAGYHISYNEVLSFNFMLIFIATIVSTKQPITASPKPPIQSEFQFRVMRTTFSFRNSSLKLRSIS